MSGGNKDFFDSESYFKKIPHNISLDEAQKEIVQNAIRNLTKNKTTLVIAHRLSTIHNADKIFVIKNGKLIDSVNIIN